MQSAKDAFQRKYAILNVQILFVQLVFTFVIDLVGTKPVYNFEYREVIVRYLFPFLAY